MKRPSTRCDVHRRGPPSHVVPAHASIRSFVHPCFCADSRASLTVHNADSAYSLLPLALSAESTFAVCAPRGGLVVRCCSRRRAAPCHASWPVRARFAARARRIRRSFSASTTPLHGAERAGVIDGSGPFPNCAAATRASARSDADALFLKRRARHTSSGRRRTAPTAISSSGFSTCRRSARRSPSKSGPCSPQGVHQGTLVAVSAYSYP